MCSSSQCKLVQPTAMCIFSFLLLPVTNAIWWCSCLIAKVKCCVFIGIAGSLHPPQTPHLLTWSRRHCHCFFHMVSLFACSPLSLSQAIWCVEGTLCLLNFSGCEIPQPWETCASFRQELKAEINSVGVKRPVGSNWLTRIKFGCSLLRLAPTLVK